MRVPAGYFHVPGILQWTWSFRAQNPVRTVPVCPRPHDHDAAEEEAASEWVRCQSASTTWSAGGSAFSAIGTVSLLATASRMEACTFWNARTSI